MQREESGLFARLLVKDQEIFELSESNRRLQDDNISIQYMLKRSSEELRKLQEYICKLECQQSDVDQNLKKQYLENEQKQKNEKEKEQFYKQREDETARIREQLLKAEKVIANAYCVIKSLECEKITQDEKLIIQNEQNQEITKKNKQIKINLKEVKDKVENCDKIIKIREDEINSLKSKLQEQESKMQQEQQQHSLIVQECQTQIEQQKLKYEEMIKEMATLHSKTEDKLKQEIEKLKQQIIELNSSYQTQLQQSQAQFITSNEKYNTTIDNLSEQIKDYQKRHQDDCQLFEQQRENMQIKLEEAETSKQDFIFQLEQQAQIKEQDQNKKYEEILEQKQSITKQFEAMNRDNSFLKIENLSLKNKLSPFLKSNPSSSSLLLHKRTNSSRSNIELAKCPPNPNSQSLTLTSHNLNPSNNQAISNSFSIQFYDNKKQKSNDKLEFNNTYENKEESLRIPRLMVNSQTVQVNSMYTTIDQTVDKCQREISRDKKGERGYKEKSLDACDFSSILSKQGINSPSKNKLSQELQISLSKLLGQLEEGRIKEINIGVVQQWNSNENVMRLENIINSISYELSKNQMRVIESIVSSISQLWKMSLQRIELLKSNFSDHEIRHLLTELNELNQTEESPNKLQHQQNQVQQKKLSNHSNDTSLQIKDSKGMEMQKEVEKVLSVLSYAFEEQAENENTANFSTQNNLFEGLLNFDKTSTLNSFAHQIWLKIMRLKSQNHEQQRELAKIKLSNRHIRQLK